MKQLKKILIVDDEALVRMGIKVLLTWEKHGYTIIGDAQSGSDALEKIEKLHPDILLTDLKMEPMDGLTLIRICREHYPGIVVIVLSNYNDMDNVKAAMKLGAADYVFKLTIKPEEMIRILDENTKDLLKTINHETEDKGQDENLMRIGLMTKTIESRNGKELAGYLSTSSGMDFGKPWHAVSMRISNYDILCRRTSFRQDLASMTAAHIAENVFHAGKPVVIFPCHSGELIIYRSLDSEDPWQLAEECKKISLGIRRILGVGADFTSSRIYQSIDKVGTAAIEASEIRNLYYHHENTIFSMDDVRHQDDTTMNDLAAQILNEPIEEDLEKGLVIEAIRKMSDYAKKIGTIAYISKKTTAGLLQQIHRPISVELQRRGLYTDQIRDYNQANFNEAILGYSCYEDLTLSLEDLLGQYAKQYAGDHQAGKRREIVLVQRYIEENLTDNISVEQMARLSNMSESRFAHVFKKEVGIALGEYVQQKRMNKAARLLVTTDEKIGSVAVSVGYDNPNYFSAQFRRYFGKSPADYRKMSAEQQNVIDFQQKNEDR